MPIVDSRTDLNQGASLAVASAIFAAGTGSDIRIHTSASNLLPALAVNEFFEVRDHSNTQNNGLYQVVTATTSTDDYECNKVFGASPIIAAVESIITLGATGVSTEKSVFFDTTQNGSIALLEQGNVSVDGGKGDAVYSFAMQEYKDDDFFMANSPFPMLTIDLDAGKFIIGQDISGNNNGATWLDAPAFGIRTRKLLRNAGWNEVDDQGNTIAREVGVLTVDAVEDPLNDTGYYRFGTDTTIDNTVDFDFPGAINEAVRFFEEQAQTDLVITTTTITRVGGSFIDEGYVVGGQVTVRSAEDVGNDGTHLLSAVSALVLTTTGLTANLSDTTAILAVNNDNAFTMGLRVRDGDTNGKTYSQSNIVALNKPALGNFVFQFPMANATDLKITATDVTISGSAPYTGMSITLHSTPQARSGLVGGSGNFGFIGEANTGTDIQFFEFVQYSLRQLTDIDAGAGVNIGRTIDLLSRFNGDILELGSPDGGVSFPENPEGGGSGFFCDNLNAASANTVKFYDNTGALRSKPETIAVTLDFNQIAIDDTTTEYNLYYDRTIETLAGALTDFVLTLATGKMTSAGTNLPTNSQISVGKYIRISGLTGVNDAMNGVYQITVITTPGADWTVVRYDSQALVDVTTTAVQLDQNCIDTPDAIIVHTNVVNTESGSTITFTAPDTISDSANGFTLAAGDIIEIEGTSGQVGIYEVDTAAIGAITTIEQTITTEVSSTDTVVTKIVSGLADVDEVFSYDFDGNVQGGRTVSTDTYVKAKAIGSTGAQMVPSAVSKIESGTPLTIPLSPATERNYK